MKMLSLQECQRDLAALDAADQLTTAMKGEIERFKTMDSQGLIKKAMGMLMSGNLSLEGLGLPANLFEQIEQLEKINSVARTKYRARVLADKAVLEDIEPAQIVEA